MRPRKSRSTTLVPAHESTVLVLQGGGALGAYQAGVYEGMHEAGLAPDWVTGVSIGAINAALIAGNHPDDRLPRLKEFWDLVSSGLPLAVPAEFDLLRMIFNRWSASASAAFGVPGFFVPRMPPPLLSPDGTLRRAVDLRHVAAQGHAAKAGQLRPDQPAHDTLRRRRR